MRGMYPIMILKLSQKRVLVLEENKDLEVELLFPCNVLSRGKKKQKKEESEGSKKTAALYKNE